MTTHDRTRRPVIARRSAAALAVLALVVAACGSDEDSSSDSAPADTTATTEAATESTEAMTETTEAMTEDTAAAGGDIDLMAFDANGDGEVRIGIAAAGPRDDGAYYQAVVDAAEEFSAENGLGEVIVVDNIEAANAATELKNLAQQPVDIMIVGASEIAEPMADLAEQYSDIFWYCNCGAGSPRASSTSRARTTVPASPTPPVWPAASCCVTAAATPPR